MSEEEFRALQEVANDIEARCTTAELATDQLKLEGILDSNGELAEPYRS